MYALGYSLDNLSLMALTISTGFVVDDAIVMIENISRYIEAGDKPMEAALKGAEQIGFTILSLTVSLIAVLIPLLFMGDVVGRLFREFAVTLAVTIVISAVVSLTLTPMMCARVLRRSAKEQQGRLYKASERVFERMVAFYASAHGHSSPPNLHALRHARDRGAHRRALHHVPKGFFPVRTPASFRGYRRPRDDRLRARWREKQQALAKAILEDPAVESLSSFIGADGTNTTLNSGRMSINLKPLDRARSLRVGRDPAAEARSWTRSTGSSSSCSRCRI